MTGGGVNMCGLAGRMEVDHRQPGLAVRWPPHRPGEPADAICRVCHIAKIAGGKRTASQPCRNGGSGGYLLQSMLD